MCFEAPKLRSNTVPSLLPTAMAVSHRVESLWRPFAPYSTRSVSALSLPSSDRPSTVRSSLSSSPRDRVNVLRLPPSAAGLSVGRSVDSLPSLALSCVAVCTRTRIRQYYYYYGCTTSNIRRGGGRRLASFPERKEGRKAKWLLAACSCHAQHTASQQRRPDGWWMPYGRTENSLDSLS